MAPVPARKVIHSALALSAPAAGQRADHKLGEGADDNLGKRRRDSQPVGGENRDQRQEEPQSR